MKWLLLIIFSLISMYQISYSGGFQLNDHSARSVSMGFSTVANIDDPSSIYFNPAAMVFTKSNFEISIGSSFIMPSGKFTGITDYNEQKTTSLESWNFLIPNCYVTWKTPVEGLSVGAGLFVPFGLGTKWPIDWVGRYSALETYVQTIEINPNIAYTFKIGKIPISVAAGFGYAIGNVDLKKKISTFTPEPILDLKGSGNGTTFNAALFIQPTKELKIGASYRHNIKIDYDGDVTYTDIKGLEALFVPGKGTTTLNLPNDLKIGIAYQLSDKLWIEAGFDYVGWSSYDTLAIAFDKMPGSPTMAYTSKSPRNYTNSIALRLGGEYKFDDCLFLRGGVYYDQMPLEAQNVEPVLPEGNKIGLSLGFGYKLADMLDLNVGYLFLLTTQTEVKDSPIMMNGIYNSNANILSLSLNFHF